MQQQEEEQQEFILDLHRAKQLAARVFASEFLSQVRGARCRLIELAREDESVFRDLLQVKTMAANDARAVEADHRAVLEEIHEAIRIAEEQKADRESELAELEKGVSVLRKLENKHRKELKRLKALGESGAVTSLKELAMYLKGYHDTGKGDKVTKEIAEQLSKAEQIIALQKVEIEGEGNGKA